MNKGKVMEGLIDKETTVIENFRKKSPSSQNFSNSFRNKNSNSNSKK